ncbi:MAG: cytochrome b/b6 domain-containing protein [Calothrix sp. MO_192.B10]|nr:cytochrome b/b6 domain-containing protein [Calothrix sp. MO_192.B10]
MKLTKIDPNFTPKRKNGAFKNLMFIHWTMVHCFLFLYGTGVLMPRIAKAFALANTIPFIHQSFGILIMVFLIARIFLLLRLITHKYSRYLPKITPLWLKTLILHSSLYILMLIVPVSGLLLRNLRGIDTTFFGILVPSLVSQDNRLVELTKSLHFWSSYLFLWLIMLHIFARTNVNLRIRWPKL